MARVEVMDFRSAITENLSSSLKTKKAVVNGKTSAFEQFVNQSGNNIKDSSQADRQPSSNIEVSGCYANETAKYAAAEDASLKSGGFSTGAEERTLLETEGQMKQIVKDVLGIDEDTLTDVMEQMGIVITDLLNPSVLQQFILLLTGGEEAADFLTDEGLLDAFNELLMELKQYAEEHQDSVLAMMDILEHPVDADTLDFAMQLETEEAAGNEQAEVTVELKAADAASADIEEVLESSGMSDGGQDMVTAAGSTVKESETVSETGNDSQAAGRMDNQDAQAKISVTETEEQADGKEAEDAGQQAMDSEPEEESSFPEHKEETEFRFSERQQTQRASENVHVVHHQAGNTTPVFTQTFTAQVSGGLRMQQMIDIVNQVQSQIRSLVTETVTTVEMQLHPESLGRVYMAVSSKAGVMTAMFHVQTEEAKQALESQVYQLKENLEAKNLKVESVDVQISNFDFSHSKEAESQMRENGDGKQKKKFVFDAEEDAEDASAAEEVRDRAIRDAGSSVNYIA